MKAVTEKKKQWMWFVGLWCGGLFATAMLSQAFRWLISK